MTHYTDEKQAQIVIALLKAHGVRNVIASPGTTNMCLVGSIQTDPWFRMWSAVDERSAAYMACGLTAELGEPVVLSCTGATASRNYLPGLTEAFYRKLPVLAITSMQGRARAGHHIAQVIDRSSPPADVVKLSVDLPVVKDAEDIWECEMKVNRAILELTRRGGGPVHINLPTTYSANFNERQLPDYRVINRWTADDPALPELRGRVGVFIGAHKTWTAEETGALDRFCEANDAPVFCDHTSGYRGKYRILGALIGGQMGVDLSQVRPDIMIHVGEISGDYETAPLMGKEVWRVGPDGEIRDTFRKLRHVFEMSEQRFFRLYSEGARSTRSFVGTCRAVMAERRARLPDLPLSNLWLASQLAPRIPKGAVVHFAILNSLRAWNYFELPEEVRSSSNVGGFGIDGCMSSLIGASLADPERPFFLVTGDLAFFYDMNALGSRHLGSNVRILLINNGRGVEFTQYNHRGSAFGADAAPFMAAEGHFGRQCRKLVKGYAEGLGIEYLSISAKQECEPAAARLLAPGKRERPILVEAFVDAADESHALKAIKNLDPSRKGRARELGKAILGPEGTRTVKRILGR
jgi:2-succinyl-5-enolpyruvyl-6-hydroxy-3-cyclohexene-1-carboxylate synthase